MPPHNVAVRVPERKTAHLMPSVGIVEAPYACLELVRRARADRLGEDLSDAGKIGDIHNSIASPMLHGVQRLLNEIASDGEFATQVLLTGSTGRLHRAVTKSSILAVALRLR